MRSLATRIVLGVIVAGGVWFFTGLDDANRDDSGQIVDGGDLDVTAMQPGDCFNDPEEFWEEVTHVDAVPCSEPHDNEVFAVLSVGSALGDEFPGVDVLDQYTYESCLAPFEEYTTGPYAKSSLEVFAFFPTEEGWNQDDREFSCVLFARAFSKLTGSARDSSL
ncbi:MAG TPA: septum formation family protein [Acidimicrobiia bacterium]|nr:septum formation family protein [Acidimicrobiia bacterium]